MKKSRKMKLITTLSSVGLVATSASIITTACNANTVNDNGNNIKPTNDNNLPNNDSPISNDVVTNGIDINLIDWVERTAYDSKDPEAIKRIVLIDNSDVFAQYRGLEQAVDISATYDMKTKPEISVTIHPNGSSTRYSGNDVTWNANCSVTPTPTPTPETIQKVTYSELAGMVKGNMLQNGKQYQITDFVTTTNGYVMGVENMAISAGNRFDIIVTATSTSTFDENAKATLHEGDTYFNGIHEILGMEIEVHTDFSKWEIKYCFDNEQAAKKCEWADNSPRAKGCIYYMKDEYGNSAGYDFKNIKTKPYLAENQYGENYLYTFSSFNVADCVDMSLRGDMAIISNNTIAPCVYSLDESMELIQMLNNVVFYGDMDEGYPAMYIMFNTIGTLCIDITFSFYTMFNNVGSGCVGIKGNPMCAQNIIGDFCNNIELGVEATENTIGTYGSDIKFDNGCQYNVFANNCEGITLGQNCRYNTFNENCEDATFGEGCTNNIIGSASGYINFGDYCYDNNIGNNGWQITLGNECNSNTTGSDCNYITFNYNCDYNSLGNGCQGITSDEYCQYNSFGNACDDISLGTYSRYNAFSNDCNVINVINNETEEPWRYGITSNNFGPGCNNTTINVGKIDNKEYHFDSNTLLCSRYHGNDPINITKYRTGATFIDGVEQPQSVKLVSYDDLKQAVEDKDLVVGQQYRISDYTATTTQANTLSIDHQFDIIVTAESTSTFFENAQAVKHSDEATDYFANNDLNAWTIRYSFKNDTNKFAWANETNGKGVIYYMKDEFGNEAPYDFKDILIDMHGENLYRYTFSNGGATQPDEVDLSLDGKNNEVYNNVIKPYTVLGANTLNMIVIQGIGNNNNTFNNDCHNIALADNCAGNTFGNGCVDIALLSSCSANTFGNECNSITLSEWATYNNFGNLCNNIVYIGASYVAGANETRMESNTFSSGSSYIYIGFDSRISPLPYDPISFSNNTIVATSRTAENFAQFNTSSTGYETDKGIINKLIVDGQVQ